MERTIRSRSLHTLGIVGGGRWAKIIQRVAKNNRIQTQIYSRNPDLPTVTKLEDLRSGYCWIANQPDDHFTSVVHCLSLDKHVLVEKPIVRTVLEHNKLVKLAKQLNLNLIVGLELEYSNTINDIASQVENPKKIEIVWNSKNNTQRHGEQYVSDPTISVFEDITPHVLTVLRKIVKSETAVLKTIIHNETGIEYTMQFGDASVDVTLKRDVENTRTITVDGVEYDFSTDDGKSLDRQLEAFYRGDTVNSAENTIWITRFIEKGCRQLIPQHHDIVRFNDTFTAKEIVALYTSKSIIDCGLAVSRYDPQLMIAVEQIYTIIKCYSADPFVTQQYIQQQLNVNRKRLIQLNQVIKNTEFIQTCITDDIRNQQYWHNTIIPLSQSGTIRIVLNNEYSYPHRVGLHIGQSCMFWCSFCGRNMDTNAAYKKTELKATTPDIVNLIKTAPNDDPYRFYLSGGLETLTNPDLMKLISAGYDRGFKFSLYTNGFMLTEKFVEANQDLFKLEVLRISLYGSNQQVYEQITKHKKGFERVKQNAIDFLRYKKKHNKKLRFGFNYIILPGLEQDFLEVIDLIEEINRTAGDQIDFITLRENFQTPNELDTFGDRTKIKQVFAEVEKRRNSEHLNRLHIDYGYALNALSRGIDAPTMHCITEEQMLPKGFPQVDLVVDAYGLVYLCREAGFLDRPGNDRYIIGKLSETDSLESIVRNWIRNGKPVDIQKGDTEFMDSYEHIISLMLNQSNSDQQHGIPEQLGPILAKAQATDTVSVQAFYQGDPNAKVN